MKRYKSFQQSNCRNPAYPNTPAVCCQVPEGTLEEESIKSETTTALTHDDIKEDLLPDSCTNANFICVPYFQCVNGAINRDGSGLEYIRPPTIVRILKDIPM